MGIEFHLARNDDRVVEEFLATAPTGVNHDLGMNSTATIGHFIRLDESSDSC